MRRPRTGRGIYSLPISKRIMGFTPLPMRSPLSSPFTHSLTQTLGIAIESSSTFLLIGFPVKRSDLQRFTFLKSKFKAAKWRRIEGRKFLFRSSPSFTSTDRQLTNTREETVDVHRRRSNLIRKWQDMSRDKGRNQKNVQAGQVSVNQHSNALWIRVQWILLLLLLLFCHRFNLVETQSSWSNPWLVDKSGLQKGLNGRVWAVSSGRRTCSLPSHHPVSVTYPGKREKEGKIRNSGRENKKKCKRKGNRNRVCQDKWEQR